MIEKLPFTEIHTGDEYMVDRVELRPVTPYETQHKINEIVDAVNELQKHKEPAEAECVRLQNELERTRKALEIAVDALKDIRCIYTGDQTTKPSTMFGRAAGALNKITALEQKDK